MTTILIVDTRPADRLPYTTLLSSLGHRVLEASDGSEALELARTELPDLVITDIIMPNIDGFTLTRRLHAEPLLASVPVISMSNISASQISFSARSCALSAAQPMP